MNNRGVMAVLGVLVLAVAGVVTASYVFGFTVRFESRCKSERCNTEGVPAPCCLHKALNLNREQIEKCDELDKVFKQKTATLRKEIRHDKTGLSELLMAPDVDSEKIKSTIDAVSQHQKELQLEVVNHLLSMKTILTPEQQEQFFSMIVKRMCPGGIPGKKG